MEGLSGNPGALGLINRLQRPQVILTTAAHQEVVELGPTSDFRFSHFQPTGNGLGRIGIPTAEP
jgi:hypothetical protein